MSLLTRKRVREIYEAAKVEGVSLTSDELKQLAKHADAWLAEYIGDEYTGDEPDRRWDHRRECYA